MRFNAERTGDPSEGLGRMAATMAHEFNNVLMGVLQVGEMLVRFYPNDERLTRLADQLFNATTRGRQITSEVLRYSNPQPPVIKTFDLSKWLAGFIPEIESLIAARSVRLHFEVPPEELSINSDPHQLRQALLQLATNACDAMPMGGDLTIALSSSDHDVQLSVSDTGIGMPPNTLAHIFDPLYTTKRHAIGLGLAVVHQVVKSSGGTIDVESQPGIGTTFTITFPFKGNLPCPIDSSIKI